VRYPGPSSGELPRPPRFGDDFRAPTNTSLLPWIVLAPRFEQLQHTGSGLQSISGGSSVGPLIY
jgi:hypothetical protein